MLYRIPLILFFMGSQLATNQAAESLEQSPSSSVLSCLPLIERYKEDYGIVLSACESFNQALLESLNRLEIIYSNFTYYDFQVSSTVISIYWASQYCLQIHLLKKAEEENDWFELGFKGFSGNIEDPWTKRIFSDLKMIHKRYILGLIQQARLIEQIGTLSALGAYLSDLEEEFEVPFTLERALSICLAFKDVTPEQNRFYNALCTISNYLIETQEAEEFFE
jgi:hypothetical protein